MKKAARWDGGSSPLARGTPPAPASKASLAGLIPARAGNTNSESRSNPSSWAHPRSRGEHELCPCIFHIAVGSSPLARGTLLSGFGERGCLGLIPARAGNTSACTGASTGAGAHPRSRGEHACRNFLTPSRLGSSPLARGTRVMVTSSVCAVGLIPARAGNTRRCHALA